LLLLLLFLKNEREGEEIVLFGFFQSYNSFFFSLAQNFIVFRCTSFIEREHQPSLKAIKKVRKRKEKKATMNLHRLNRQDLLLLYSNGGVGGTLIDNHVYTELYTRSI
jgi:hypothetical protein